MTPEERSLRGRIGAHAQHAKHPIEKTTAAGLAAAFSRFEKEVDPEGVLDPKERRRRANHAQREHMLRISLLSAKARKRR